MKKLKTRIFDTAEFLSSEKDMAAYLEAAYPKVILLWWCKH